jgi:hypothetical protein
MRPRACAFAIAALALCATGCERTQTIDTNSGQDKPAWQGTTNAAFAIPGWKAGDKTSWEQQLRTRTQRGQNDYNKVN